VRLRPLLVAGAVAAAWPLVEPQLPVLRRVTVPALPARSAPVRVLHVSDLHLLPRHARRAAWVRRLARHRADLVVSTGDHVGSEAAFGLLADTLGALAADGTPAVVVPGNNDYFTPIRPSLLGYLREDPPRRAPQPRHRLAGRAGPPAGRRLDRPDPPAGGARGGRAAGGADRHRRRSPAAGPLRPGARPGGRLRHRRHAHPAGPAAAGLRLPTGTRWCWPATPTAASCGCPGYGAVVTNCDLPAPGPRPEPGPVRRGGRLAARQRRAGQLAVPARCGWPADRRRPC
jgi:hypothetical protein